MPMPPTTPVPFVARTLLGLALLASACGEGKDARGPLSAREFVLAHDDNRATSALTFPNLTYESLVRLELPPGSHRPLRLRMMAEAAGTVAVTLYENAVLETPGEEIHVITREFVGDDLSSGKDGRWVVEDLRDLRELKGTVWIGVRKVGGAPALWTSAVSGQSYLRDRDPTSAMGLLPVKRTVMVRLEVLP